MARFSKAILKVGNYESPDGKVEVTPDRLKHWSRQFRRMRGNRLGIPVGWDHSDIPEETIPVAFSRGKGARTTKNSAGWLTKFDVAKDGSHAVIEMDVRDGNAEGKVKNNVVEVSPIIYPEWTDGRGRKWSDVITHVDLVNHPVDDSQSDFKPVPEGQALSCCIRMGLDTSVYKLGGSMPYRMKGKKYRMEDDEMPRKYRKDGDDEEDMDYPEDDGMDYSEDDKMMDEYEDRDEMMGNHGKKRYEMQDEGMDEGASSSRQFAEQILEDLAACGIAAPSVNPDSDPQTFLGELSASLRQKNLDEQAEEADKAREMAEETIKRQNGMMNEEDDMRRYEEKTPEFAALSLKAESAHLYGQRLHRRSLMERLDVAFKSGRCTAHQKDILGKDIGAVRLSLDGEGRPSVSEAERQLELIESYPEGAVWDNSQRLSSASEVKPPYFGDDMSDDEAKTLADQVLKGRLA